MSNLNVGLNRQIFSKITRYVDFNKESDLNYFRQILKKVGIKKVLKDALGNILDVKHFGALESKIFVNLEIIRSANYNRIDDDFDRSSYEFDESKDSPLNPLYKEFDYLCFEYREDGDAVVTDIHSTRYYDTEWDIIEELEKDNYKYRLDEFTIVVDSKEVYNKQNIFMQNSSYYHSD